MSKQEAHINELHLFCLQKHNCCEKAFGNNVFKYKQLKGNITKC